MPGKRIFVCIFLGTKNKSRRTSQEIGYNVLAIGCTEELLDEIHKFVVDVSSACASHLCRQC